ncbi:hypothetical protein EC2719100_4674 [Escherichia coli 2719100]|nr:hypothetical protein ECDEC15A_4367 [Escherichia coli DEC15A]EHX99804.1 hypothetical protein ECDEC15B_4687 [Escherichia coli DEC15B]EHY10278.1 hypothetical protein ECDEC15D_4509 [Escherichia coli DEC15D]EHY14917.1 hypothetical protein ECDEC15E_4861 [Escherichia coli DEC15E]EMX16548.1 hypothetical protein ECP03018671_4687 [Escherichia coli P0301867.1]EMX82187.1 hypothetical protein EC2719100_4674 [Escherichia coli 2719100]ENA34510.1 hypothetical protein ECP03018674_4407 [Escherichia coli P03
MQLHEYVGTALVLTIPNQTLLYNYLRIHAHQRESYIMNNSFMATE